MMGSNANGEGRCMHSIPHKKIKPIQGDGNCMFRALSYVITGSEKHHLQVRANILEHMENIASLVLGHITGRSNAIGVSGICKVVRPGSGCGHLVMCASSC